MFGGLDIKGGAERKKEEEEPAASSGFSFLSAATTAEHAPPASSGFSFLSSSAAAQDQDEAEVKPEVTEDTATVPSSGFSFLGNGATSNTTSDKADDAEEEEQEAVTAAEPAPASSGFSFLSSMIAPAPAPAPASSTLKQEEVAPASIEAPKSNGGSMFSMLNLKSEEPSAPAQIEPTSSWGSSMAASTPTTKPPLSPSNGDILSLSNPSQPTGSGVVFGGAAKPKVVKKRVRAKKIGAGPPPTPSSIAPPIPVYEVPPTEPTPVQASQPESELELESAEAKTFSHLSNAANNAANRAEEFISAKQTPSSSYAGRYYGESTIEEDYGDTTTTTTSTTTIEQKAEESEDYKKAKAAAQEAMKSANAASRKTVFGGGIGGFFKRSASISSSVKESSPVPSLSEEKVEKQEEMKVPVYGRAIPPTVYAVDVGDEDGVYDDKESGEEERLKSSQEEAAERRRLEAERVTMERQAMEKRRLEEDRRMEMEKARLVEERRRSAEVEAAKRTPDQLLLKLLEDFAAKSQKATCEVASLRQERSTMLEKRALAEKQERLATQQISQAEKQQMEAAEQEDFELADHLAAVIEQHKTDQEEKSQILDNIEGLIEDLNSRRLDVVKGVWACFNTIQSELKDFLKEQETSDIIDSTELLKKFESTTKRLQIEHLRLSADWKNIERDEGFAQEERGELEANISEQTSGIEGLRDAAGEKLKEINEEIDELRRQLEAKEMEAAQVKMELHGHQESIEQVRKKFSRQLTRLVKKESAVKESRHEWDTEKAMYKKARLEHEAEVTAHSEALMAHDKIIAQVKDEIHVAEELAKVIAQEVVVDKGIAPGEADEELIMAQAEVLKLEAAAEEANQVLAAGKSSIATLMEDISTIEVRLPIVESEKKLAASTRDFKAAAKASKEIKELIAKKERCREELDGEALERQRVAQKEVEVCLEALELKKAAAHEQEKKDGSRRMVQLVKKIINLEKLREEVCGTEEDDGVSVKSVGGFVLDSEISALMMEGDELDKKYGGWDEIMLEYASGIEREEEDEEEEAIIENLEAETETEQVDQEGETDQPEGEEDAGEAEEETNEESKEEHVSKYKDMVYELKTLESMLELAIETEEYEDAAHFDDQIAAVTKSMESLGLTADEIEKALSGAPAIDERPELNGDSANKEIADDKETPVDEEADGDDEGANEEIADDEETPVDEEEDGDDEGANEEIADDKETSVDEEEDGDDEVFDEDKEIDSPVPNAAKDDSDIFDVDL